MTLQHWCRYLRTMLDFEKRLLFFFFRLYPVSFIPDGYILFTPWEVNTALVFIVLIVRPKLLQDFENWTMHACMLNSLGTSYRLANGNSLTRRCLTLVICFTIINKWIKFAVIFVVAAVLQKTWSYCEWEVSTHSIYWVQLVRGDGFVCEIILLYHHHHSHLCQLWTNFPEGKFPNLCSSLFF